MKNVRLDLNTVCEFCDAYQHICKAVEFDFALQGAICRSKNINGEQRFLLPEHIEHRKFRAVLDATQRLAKEIASVGLNDKEVALFIAELFEHRAYMARAETLLLEMKSKLQVTDARATMALAALLENKMKEAIASVEVTITAEMLKERRKKVMPDETSGPH